MRGVGGVAKSALGSLVTAPGRAAGTASIWRGCSGLRPVMCLIFPVSGSLVVSTLSRTGGTLLYSGRRSQVSPSSLGRVGGTGRRDMRWAGGPWTLQSWVTHSLGKGLKPFMHVVFISCKGLQKKIEGQNVLSQGREWGHSRAVPSEPWCSFPLCWSH